MYRELPRRQKCSSKNIRPEATNQREPSEITLMQKTLRGHASKSEDHARAPTELVPRLLCAASLAVRKLSLPKPTCSSLHTQPLPSEENGAALYSLSSKNGNQVPSYMEISRPLSLPHYCRGHCPVCQCLTEDGHILDVA